MSNESAKAGLRIMALLEGAKGVLVLAAGLGLFALAHRDVQSLAEELVRHLHLNPARRFPRIFLHLAANLTDQRLWGLAAAAIVYSLMRLVEAWGLWRGWQWTKWFAAVSGGIYIPIEAHSAFHHFAWAKVIVLGVNTLVVAYLFFHLVNKRRRTCRPWEPQAVCPVGFLIAALLLCRASAVAADAPPSRDRPWHSAGEGGLRGEATSVRTPDIPVDPARSYSLVELIDLAETHNPETRFAWERARAQAATLGLARSELYPTLAASVLAQIDRETVFFGTSFYRHTIQEIEPTFVRGVAFFVVPRKSHSNRRLNAFGAPWREM